MVQWFLSSLSLTVVDTRSPILLRYDWHTPVGFNALLADLDVCLGSGVLTHAQCLPKSTKYNPPENEYRPSPSLTLQSVGWKIGFLFLEGSQNVGRLASSWIQLWWEGAWLKRMLRAICHWAVMPQADTAALRADVTCEVFIDEREMIAQFHW